LKKNIDQIEVKFVFTEGLERAFPEIGMFQECDVHVTRTCYVNDEEEEVLGKIKTVADVLSECSDYLSGVLDDFKTHRYSKVVLMEIKYVQFVNDSEINFICKLHDSGMCDFVNNHFKHLMDQMNE
jgi:hypothetical protein